MESLDLKLIANHYYKLGLNVTCISDRMNEFNFYSNDILKAPNHKWEHLFKTKLTQEEFDKYNFKEACGIGFTSGYNSLLTIDLDGCSDYNLLDEIVNMMDLPLNYEWIIKSGSNNGFHIIVECTKFEFLTENDAVTTYWAKDKYSHLIDKIEFLWMTHCTLPPSIHKSGGNYEFLNGKIPQSLPIKINVKLLDWIIEKYLVGERVVIGAGYFTNEQGRQKWMNNIHGVLDQDFSYNLMDARQKKNITGFQENQIRFISSSNQKLRGIHHLTVDKYHIVPLDIVGKVEYASNKLNENCMCVFDLETDGLPTDKHFPNILQLAWVIMTKDGIILKKESSLIRPKRINPEGFKFNSLELRQIEKLGAEASSVLRKLVADIKTTGYIAAHNLEFDLSILEHHISVNNLPSIPKDIKQICTMKESTNYCKLESYEYEENYKYPKLTELYECLFNTQIRQIHNAESDVLITARCLKQLIRIGEIDLE